MQISITQSKQNVRIPPLFAAKTEQTLSHTQYLIRCRCCYYVASESDDAASAPKLSHSNKNKAYLDLHWT